jgi:hypothetical protein
MEGSEKQPISFQRNVQYRIGNKGGKSGNEKKLLLGNRFGHAKNQK